MGAFGAEHIMKNCKPTSDGKHRVMTHCNTGALATAGYGTALGELSIYGIYHHHSSYQNVCYYFRFIVLS